MVLVVGSMAVIGLFDEIKGDDSFSKEESVKVLRSSGSTQIGLQNKSSMDALVNVNNMSKKVFDAQAVYGCLDIPRSVALKKLGDIAEVIGKRSGVGMQSSFENFIYSENSKEYRIRIIQAGQEKQMSRRWRLQKFSVDSEGLPILDSVGEHDSYAKARSQLLKLIGDHPIEVIEKRINIVSPVLKGSLFALNDKVKSLNVIYHNRRLECQEKTCYCN